MKKEQAMKNISVAIIGVLALGVTSPALAKKSSVSQREYQRGYKDCSVGKYDQEQHGASYKKGCRAAEDKKGGAAKPACPPDVSEANRYQYPGCN